ncbi:MAG: hypothetical protein ABI830_07885 [Pseudolabrys sp.]
MQVQNYSRTGISPVANAELPAPSIAVSIRWDSPAMICTFQWRGDTITKAGLLMTTMAFLFSTALLAGELPCTLTPGDYDAIAHAMNTPTANETKQPGCEPGCVLSRDGIARLSPKELKNLCVARRLVNDLKIMDTRKYMQAHKPSETPVTVKRYVTESEYNQLARIDIKLAPQTYELLISPTK